MNDLCWLPWYKADGGIDLVDMADSATLLHEETGSRESRITCSIR
jgi:hypothetical protein